MPQTTGSRKLHGAAVTLHDDVDALGEPSGASAGGDITSWRDAHGFAPRDAAVIIKRGAGASVDPTVTGPALRGYDATDAAWRDIGDLHDGNDIDVTTTLEWEQRVFDVGTFDRLAVVGTPSDNVTVVVKPIEDAQR